MFIFNLFSSTTSKEIKNPIVKLRKNPKNNDIEYHFDVQNMQNPEYQKDIKETIELINQIDSIFVFLTKCINMMDKIGYNTGYTYHSKENKNQVLIFEIEETNQTNQNNIKKHITFQDIGDFLRKIVDDFLNQFDQHKNNNKTMKEVIKVVSESKECKNFFNLLNSFLLQVLHSRNKHTQIENNTINQQEIILNYYEQEILKIFFNAKKTIFDKSNQTIFDKSNHSIEITYDKILLLLNIPILLHQQSNQKKQINEEKTAMEKSLEDYLLLVVGPECLKDKTTFLNNVSNYKSTGLVLMTATAGVGGGYLLFNNDSTKKQPEEEKHSLILRKEPEQNTQTIKLQTTNHENAQIPNTLFTKQPPL
jgi:hypothetical protein